MASHDNLPPVSSPSLVLTRPTDVERERVWKGTHPHWGAALTMEDYIAREHDNLEAALARDDGVTSWILTDGSMKPDDRPILSSCETYKKRALVSSKEGRVRDGTAFGVASVFTFPECRGKGYASKMMSLLADELRGRQQKNEGDADFSVLWSDVGPKFYNAVGWKPFESTWLEFPVTETEHTAEESVKPITLDDIPDLAARDEELLRKGVSSPSSRVRAAVVPDAITLQWHIHRGDFMCKHLFSRTPTVHGALYTPPDTPNSRIWAIWTGNFYGMLDKPEKNILRIVRLVIEDETISDETLTKGIQAIASSAQKTAKEWSCSKVEVWNPQNRVQKAAESIQSLRAKFFVRENNNIASLQWFGEDSNEGIEWIANEKFAWC
ncbi:lysine acetyltransferase [Fusarium heterosporum]|uniref:Lysine acetyltransferase n=1 Tax=Fusarium heterosporum TaxID=42747 RepID=A0A8H5U147_FUSHE|nr:lysine acetyltransferase [Fusarium heterosporum]